MVKEGLAPRERMVLRAAREIEEGETVFVGTRLPLLAYLVAKATHAPNAVALYENGLIREEAARELLFTMGDPPNILNATSASTTLDVMGMMQAGRVDLGLLGGAEVDRYGNVNSTEVAADGGGTTRLPGSGGAADIASLARRTVILVPQEKRRLVERVRFRTSPGYGDGPDFRERAGLPPGGPTAIVTTHAVLRFDRAIARDDAAFLAGGDRRAPPHRSRGLLDRPELLEAPGGSRIWIPRRMTCPALEEVAVP